jgi:hypothetical protein
MGTPTPLRAMLVIAHFFKPIQGSIHSSTTESMRQVRIDAMRKVLLHWAALCEQSYVLDIETKRFVQGEHSAFQLDIFILVNEQNHLIDKPTAQKFKLNLVQVNTPQPKLLPFGAHKLMADHKDRYDWYIYSEDDLVMRDVQVFDKQQAFQDQFGLKRLLQPNRYELNVNGPSLKTYIDGNLRAAFIDKYLALVAEPETQLHLDYAGKSIDIQRARNPHSGFFMLSQEQLGYWVKQPNFMDMDCSFVSPLESAATLAVLKSFGIFKPLGPSMRFFEVEHLDRKFSGMSLPKAQLSNEG